jgi:predicted metal-binding membrane protein
MSLTWMVAVAGLIAIEKLLPWRKLANRLVAVTLAALAFGVALAPGDVPGLTRPDSPAAQKSMSEMSDGARSAPVHEAMPMKRK